MQSEDTAGQPTHVVIGAGTSGLCLVRRLLAHNHNVILLERSDFRLGDTGSTISRDGVDSHDPTVEPSWMHRALNIAPYNKIWSYEAYSSDLSTALLTRPQSGLYQRVVNYVQGYGATSDINAMIFSLGSKEVYDRLWPKRWSSLVMGGYMNDVLQYFKPTRIHTSGAMRKLLSGHGIGITGPLLDETYCTNEFWYCEDHNSVDGCSSVAYFASITKDSYHNDRRLRIADCLQYDHHSDPAPHGKLTIMSSVHVTRIVFNNSNKAVSVLIRGADSAPGQGQGEGCLRTVSPSDGGEIILCAGVFESPRILISSGLKASAQDSINIVGPSGADMTAEQGRSFVESGGALPHLAAIGENFQDHVILPYILLGNWYVDWNIIHHPGSSYKGQAGRYPLNSVHGWIDLDDHGDPCCEGSSTIPSAQLLFVDGRILGGLVDIALPRFSSSNSSSSSLLYLYSRLRAVLVAVLQLIGRSVLFQWLSGYVFGVLVCVTQPHSRGSLVMADPNDPDRPLSIDPRYLSDPRDIRILHNAHQTAREIVSRARIQHRQLTCVELLPGPLFNYAATFAWFELYASLLASTYFHGCGTCAMSTTATSSSSTSTSSTATSSSSTATGGVERVGRDSVVLEDFRVQGVSGLRVVDASVIPAIPSCPLQALCMVLAEGCADLLTAGTIDRSIDEVSLQY